MTYWGMEDAYPATHAPVMCRESACPVAAQCLLHALSGTLPMPETRYPGFAHSRNGCGHWIPAHYRGARVRQDALHPSQSGRKSA